MFDTKLQTLKYHFGISTDLDWQSVRPEWILSIDGCGPKILEFIRLMLAVKDLSLKDDKTPEYWRLHKGNAKIVEVLGNEEMEDDDGNIAAKDRGIILPITVLIDSAEQAPYTFQNFRHDGRPLIVPQEFRSLQRYPQSLGDYSLDTPLGGFGRCHVERKSQADAYSTFLGWARKGEDIGRRDRFEAELEALGEMEAGLVIVECSWDKFISETPQFGVRSAALNAITLENSVASWQRKYKVAWHFASNRRLAERYTLRWLRQWYDAQVIARKAERKEMDKRRQKLLPVSPPAVASEVAFDAELASI